MTDRLQWQNPQEPKIHEFDKSLKKENERESIMEKFKFYSEFFGKHKVKKIILNDLEWHDGDSAKMLKSQSKNGDLAMITKSQMLWIEEKYQDGDYPTMACELYDGGWCHKLVNADYLMYNMGGKIRIYDWQRLRDYLMLNLEKIEMSCSHRNVYNKGYNGVYTRQITCVPFLDLTKFEVKKYKKIEWKQLENN